MHKQPIRYEGQVSYWRSSRDEAPGIIRISDDAITFQSYGMSLVQASFEIAMEDILRCERLKSFLFIRNKLKIETVHGEEYVITTWDRERILHRLSSVLDRVGANENVKV